MIKTYANKETQRIAELVNTRKFPQNIINRAIIRLTMIDTAQNINDLINPPSNQLEKLHGHRFAQYSIRINMIRNPNHPCVFLQIYLDDFNITAYKLAKDILCNKLE